MGLTNNQKLYIKRNIRHFSVAKIASDLGLSEIEVRDYLKKKWSPEKYKKFSKNRNSAEQSAPNSDASFNFSRYFWKNRLVFLFLAVLVFISYANTFGNGFVSDDVMGFERNPNVGSFSSVTGNPMHFSLLGFFQMIAFHVGGLHPLTFRIINIAAHLGIVFAIFTLLDLSLKKRVALISASLFAIHPILTEAVSWISGGIYSFYALFFLPSFLFYLFSGSSKKYYYYSIVCYVLSISSSEKAIVLFLVFALYEFTFGSLRENWKKIIPYFSISFALALLYVSKIGSRVSDISASTYQQPSAAGGFYNPLVQIPIAIGSYLKLIFWPAKLTLYQTEMAFTQMQYLFFVFIVLVFAAAIIFSWFKNKNIFFWLVFFIIPLLPTLTPFKISWVVAERYVYLSTLGIIVCAAIIIDKFLKINENSKMIGYFFLALAVSALSVRTIIRNQDWKSEDTLWLATAAVAPSGQQIHNNLGDVYARQGNLQKAVEEFSLAIQINPNYADAYHNRANTYQQMGQLDQALADYQKATEINPKLWQSFQNMASIYFSEGKYDLALENMKKAVEISPGDENLQKNLQVIQAKMQEQ